MVVRHVLVILALIGLAFVLFVIAIYASFFLLISLFTKSKSNYLCAVEGIENSSDKLPPVSIIVNAFNESKIIRRKIEDLSKLDYPHEKMEVLVIDNNSTDDTSAIAQKAIAESKLKGSVLKNPSRLGLNESLNVAFAKARNDVLCVTDSDVLLDARALKKAVSVLKSFENAGGITGRLVPVSSGANTAVLSENSYRSYYDRAMLSESSFHSAFPGNGPLVVFDKTTVNPLIPTGYGSTDANIAMNVIKSGKRFLYVPDAVFYEPVAETFKDQKLQKVRRAKRLLQVMLHNSDVFGNNKYGKFGTRLFPLKFFLYVVCPLLIFLSAILFSLYVAFAAPFLIQIVFLLGVSCALSILAVSRSARYFVVSFMLHQVYLVLGLFSAFRRSGYWKTIERKRNLSKMNSNNK